jgi:PAS domain S-box-containing protein
LPQIESEDRVSPAAGMTTPARAEEAVIQAGALQKAIFNSANFSSIATDARGVIQIFNVGAERMLGYTAAEVVNKITPADISDPQEVVARAKALSVELGTSITPGFEALAFKASRGIEDIYELTYIRKDGSRLPAVVSVTALRDAYDAIIGYLLIGTDNTARKQAEEALLKAGALQKAIFDSANFSSIATDAKGVIQIFNVGAERMLGYTAAEVMNKVTPADISDPQEVVARAEALSVELGTSINPGFEALAFKASRGIEDIYELTYVRKDGSRFPAVVSVTALRDAQDAIIGYLLIGTDNTARKQAEEALLQAGALQSAIFNSANFSSIATDAKGVIQIFNVGAERMLGYAAAEVMNKITPADISDPEEVIARAKALSVELGTPITPGFEALVFKASRGIEDIYELTYIRKDGSRFPAVVSVTALRDAQDTIIGYLLIGTEIKAGALQKAIFDNANFSSIATDAKGVIQIFNVGAERMLGYAAAEVMNKITPADISDPEEVVARAKALSAELDTPIKPGFEALVFKATRGIEDIYELTYIRKDGSRFPAVVSVTALRDAQNAIIGYLLIGTDNTARKQAEEALLKAGALQNAIFNSANFSSIATDANGVIQIFNVGAERMLGYTAADVMNKITPADISDSQEVIARAAALSTEIGTTIAPGFEALVFKASRTIEDIYELTYIRKDGSRFPAVVSVTALRDAQEAIIGYLLIGTDNTARKLVELEKKKVDQRLHEANEEIQRFAYIVSHDLRSPLVNIMGFASEIDAWQKQVFERIGFLRARADSDVDAKDDEAMRGNVEEALGFIKSSVSKMDRLIAALLKLSREGQRQFQPQVIDMSLLLQSTREAVAFQAQAVNAHITIAMLPNITSDRLALEQVFSNIMDNAVKYLRPKMPGSIEVRATETDRTVTYEIHDNGRGIAARDSERIFDLFRRSGIQDRPGDGIGLAHALALVRRLGGTIQMESEPEHGSVFKVTLPKKWAPAATEVAA